MFSKGNIPWNKGKKRPPFSRAWRQHMSEGHKGLTSKLRGRKLTWLKDHQFRKGQVAWNKGVRRTTAERKRMSEAVRQSYIDGRVPWNKGKRRPPFSKEWRDKMSAAGLGRPHTYQQGEKNWQWKGGITPIHKRLRTTLAYRQWRRKVLARDSYRCVFCGCDDRSILEVDHILPFVKHLHLRHVVGNGRTLCKPCHKTTPTYGNKEHGRKHLLVQIIR